jgi:hypothetical protein
MIVGRLSGKFGIHKNGWALKLKIKQKEKPRVSPWLFENQLC